MKVLLTVASLLPSFGGPAFSVSQLGAALAAQGAEIGLWAADGSAPRTAVVSDMPGLTRLDGSLDVAFSQFGRADVLHDNGIWLPHNHRLADKARALRMPRLVSTRGMLEPWARRHKAWKKVVAWRLYQRGDLRDAQGLHATAPAEAENLERLGLQVPVTTIPNGVSLPDTSAVGGRRATQGRLRTALFIGRIYPVKGLPMLVQAWARARPDGWRLVIAGPDERGHKAEVQKAIESAGLAGAVEFAGPLNEAQKSLALMGADLFVLPSLSESFGMVVGESLAHGVPVLTTTAVPWPSLGRQGCGWTVEPTIEGLAAGIVRATATSPGELRAMGVKGRALIASEFSWEGVAGAFGRLYESLITTAR